MKSHYFASVLFSLCLLSCNNEISEFRLAVFSSPSEVSNSSYKKLLRSFKKRMGHDEVETSSEQLLSLDSIWLSADIRLAKDDGFVFADAYKYPDSVLLATSCSEEHYLNASNHLREKRHDIQSTYYNDTYQLNEIYLQNVRDFDIVYHLNNVNIDYKKISIPGVFAEISALVNEAGEIKCEYRVAVKAQKGVMIDTITGYYIMPEKYTEYKDFNILKLPFLFSSMANFVYNVIVYDQQVFCTVCSPDYVSDEQYLVLTNLKNSSPQFYSAPEICVFDKKTTKRMNISLGNNLYTIDGLFIFKDVLINRISEEYLPEFQNKHEGELCIAFDFFKTNTVYSGQNKPDTNIYYSVLF